MPNLHQGGEAGVDCIDIEYGATPPFAKIVAANDNGVLTLPPFGTRKRLRAPAKLELLN